MIASTRPNVFQIALIAMCLAGKALADPTTRPSVPALVFNGSSPHTFIADGITLFAKTGGVGFRVVTDGKRELVSVFDPADGTPLALSNGTDTLYYDLQNERILRNPNRRSYVRIDWNAADPKPLDFSFGVEESQKADSLFRMDKFLEAQADRLQVTKEDQHRVIYSAKRIEGQVESLELDTNDPSWFHFASRTADGSYDRVVLKVSSIDKPIPDELFAFPDPWRFPKDFHCVDLEGAGLVEFLKLAGEGRAAVEKMGLALGPEVRKDSEGMFPKSMDWDDLKKRDERFGASYRQALTAQQIVFTQDCALPEKQPKH